MKSFRFFFENFFIKRWVLSLTMIIVLFSLDFTSFKLSRSLIQVFNGFNEIKPITENGTYVFNISENAPDLSAITLEKTREAFQYLDDNYDYAVDADGFLCDIPNRHDFEIPFSYLNENFYKLKGFSVEEGSQDIFKYSFTDDSIPVIVGNGLGKEYPIGSIIEYEDSVFGKTVKYKVTGILKRNTCQSNLYVLNSKTYLNYSIIVPVNADSIQKANLNFYVNAILNIIIMHSNEKACKSLADYFRDNLNVELSFSGQSENIEFFKDYYRYTIIILLIVFIVLALTLSFMCIWNSISLLKLGIKDFTINMLVGLSLNEMKNIFARYYACMSAVVMVFVVFANIYANAEKWGRKNSTEITIGLFGFIGADYLALLFAALLNAIIIFFIIKIIIVNMKKIPISLGVMQ
jgi:hypothetical protein